MLSQRPWTIAEDGIVLAELVEISLQRTVIAAAPAHGPLPSYGRAPLAAADAHVVAGAGVDEGFWIGFEPLTGATQVALRVRVETPRAVDAVTGRAWRAGVSDTPRNYLVVPPDRWLTGIRENLEGATRQFVAAAPASGVANCQRLQIALVGVRPGLPPATQATVEWASFTRIAGADVRIDILSAAEFASVTGRRVPALVESDRYRGRRLP